MSNVAERKLSEAVQSWDQGAWSLAALVVAIRADGNPELTAAAKDLVAALGLAGSAGGLPQNLPTSRPEQLASQAAAPLHQTSVLVSGREVAWVEQSDEALRAQGEASAQGAQAFATFMLPHMADLKDRLDAPGARMLDVGTGVGALAVAYAEVFPQLQVVGLDVLDRALDLARQTIAASAAADRVSVRKQDVAEFTDDDGFDLAWLPAPFIPESALRKGLPRVVAGLRPGGWLVVGHGKIAGQTSRWRCISRPWSTSSRSTRTRPPSTPPGWPRCGTPSSARRSPSRRSTPAVSRTRSSAAPHRSTRRYSARSGRSCGWYAGRMTSTPTRLWSPGPATSSVNTAAACRSRSPAAKRSSPH